jgi:LemA protein
MQTIFIIALLIPLVWGVWTYNRLVRKRNQVNEAWAGIDVQLQRRYELVPNLVATVKGYMKHESGVLERVTRLRATPGMETGERASQESGLSRSIGRLFAVAEDYPDLKASEGFMQLHASLVEIEEQLQYARRYYNGSVRDNNNLVEGFPSMLIARLFGFHQAVFFEIELASQRQAPEIDLNGT